MEKRNKILGAAIAANVLEWYDFGLYGYFAPILAQLFFPAEDSVRSLISTFMVFAVGFLVRPIGAVFFGRMGDRVSRHKALGLAIMLMALPTTLMGMLPTYSQVGAGACVLLILIRIVQGFSVGGQLGTSLTVLVEHSPPGRRGFFGSWSNGGAVIGMLMGSGAGAIITRFGSSEWVNTWGWRIPFLLGALVGIIGLYIKRSTGETQAFQKADTSGTVAENPAKEALKYHWPVMAAATGMVWVSAVSFYMVFVYMTTYLSTETHIPLSTSLELNTISMGFFMAILMLMGALSDRIGRKPVLLGGAGMLIIISYPLFCLLSQGRLLNDFMAQMAFALAVGAIQGTLPTTIVELFPTRIRCTALALAYNTGFAVFGGTAPLVCTFLIQQTGDKLSPGYYLIFVSLVSGALFLGLKETFKKKLHDI
jgi:MHS family proline/betaine transporter-like MFS transporter